MAKTLTKIVLTSVILLGLPERADNFTLPKSIEEIPVSTVIPTYKRRRCGDPFLLSEYYSYEKKDPIYKPSK